jgi:transposase
MVGYAAGLLQISLREKAYQWWYFLDHTFIPHDNNLEESSLGLTVTKRKVSDGFRSGSALKERSRTKPN